VPDPAHDRYREDLAAFLLGALDDDEAREFEHHLAGCAACQAEERWLRAAIEVLPASVEQIEPPPQLRERLMATVREEAKAEADGARQRRRKSRRRFGFVLRPAAVFAGAALIVLAGVGGYVLGNGGDEGTTTVAVRATGVQPSASGELTKADRGYPAIVRVRGLKPESGRVYEVWLRRKGSKDVTPSSLFAVKEDGTGSAAIPGGLGGVAEVLVSSEPEGGSTAPTTDPVLRATL
jgi:anti-sigma-K factor RskA